MRQSQQSQLLVKIETSTPSKPVTPDKNRMQLVHFRENIEQSGCLTKLLRVLVDYPSVLNDWYRQYTAKHRFDRLHGRSTVFIFSVH